MAPERIEKVRRDSARGAVENQGKAAGCVMRIARELPGGTAARNHLFDRVLTGLSIIWVVAGGGRSPFGVGHFLQRSLAAPRRDFLRRIQRRGLVQFCAWRDNPPLPRSKGRSANPTEKFPVRREESIPDSDRNYRKRHFAVSLQAEQRVNLRVDESGNDLRRKLRAKLQLRAGWRRSCHCPIRNDDRCGSGISRRCASKYRSRR